jgi:hypothetical protein
MLNTYLSSFTYYLFRCSLHHHPGRLLIYLLKYIYLIHYVHLFGVIEVTDCKAAPCRKIQNIKTTLQA